VQSGGWLAVLRDELQGAATSRHSAFSQDRSARQALWIPAFAEISFLFSPCFILKPFLSTILFF